MAARRLPPNGFWSYSRKDDSLSKERLSSLRRILADEIQQQFGREEIRLFQDVEAIRPGSEWEREINAFLDKSTFFIPIITPNFIQSEWCCAEVTIFREREEELLAAYPGLPRRSRIFPLYLIDIRGVEAFDPKVLSVLETRQWIDFRAYRFRKFEDEAVQNEIAKFAASIRDLLNLRLPPPAPDKEEVERLATIERERKDAERQAAAERERLEAERRDAAEREREEAEKRALAERERLNAEQRALAERRRQEEDKERERQEAERQAAEATALAERTRQEEEQRAERARCEEERRVRLEQERAERERLAAERRQRAAQAAAARRAAGRAFFAKLARLSTPKKLIWAAIAIAVVGILAELIFLVLPALHGPSARLEPGLQAVRQSGVPPSRAQPPAPAQARPAPAHAWLYGRWGIAGDCTDLRTIRGDSNRIILELAGESPQVELVGEATPERIRTDISVYERAGSSVNVRETRGSDTVNYRLLPCAR